MFSLNEIAEIVDGKLFISKDFAQNSNALREKKYDLKISIDSRQITTKDIFLAIVGENNNAHEYIDKVVEKGCELIILSDRNYINDKSNFILVDDTVIALGKIAKVYLQSLDLKTIGITGSSGKTTTKDILAQLLIEKYGEKGVVYPEKSFNNEIGVPLTILKANSQTKILILEMGASGIGHLKYLTDIAPLDYAIVLFVGSAHLGGFGSFESIVRAKAELVAGLKPNGVAILNANDPNVAKMANETKCRSFFYSAKGEFCELWAEKIEVDEKQRPKFILSSPSGCYETKLSLSGKHNVINALAAAALMVDLGYDIEDIALQLPKIGRLSSHRLDIRELENGCIVIDDAYNANPDSMKAGLTCLSNIAKEYNKNEQRRCVAVLGQMLELGNLSDQIHREIACFINNLNIDTVITVGKYAKPLYDKLSKTDKYYCDDILEVENIIKNYLTSKDIVLFKGSNGSKVWKVADKAIRGEY